MKTAATVKNWVEGPIPNILQDIHQNEVNIAIYNRDTNGLDEEIKDLLNREVSLDISGPIDYILNEVSKLNNQDANSMIVLDVQNLLGLFKDVTKASQFRLFLATINTNMCRRFHMDANNLRLLCTYNGPGTLWLTEDNINRKALNTYEDNDSIVVDKTNINQVKTGSVIILKGSKYQQKSTKGAVHRSPTIEESGETRLLIRIDPI